MRTVIMGVLALVLATGAVVQAGKGTMQQDQTRDGIQQQDRDRVCDPICPSCQFVDEDGDGICDNCGGCVPQGPQGPNGADDDSDGIPNGQDDDYVPPCER